MLCGVISVRAKGMPLSAYGCGPDNSFTKQRRMIQQGKMTRGWKGIPGFWLAHFSSNGFMLVHSSQRRFLDPPICRHLIVPNYQTRQRSNGISLTFRIVTLEFLVPMVLPPRANVTNGCRPHSSILGLQSTSSLLAHSSNMTRANWAASNAVEAGSSGKK